MSLLCFYFPCSESLTGVFGNEPHEMAIIMNKFTGSYAPFFWGMVILNFVVPVGILSFRRLRTLTGIAIASVAVVIGMWLERLNIVVPTLSDPRLPYPHQVYIPSLVEWALFVAGLSMFALAFLVFSKLFPVISIWEIEEGRKEGMERAAERIASYQPDMDTTTGAAE